MRDITATVDTPADLLTFMDAVTFTSKGWSVIPVRRDAKKPAIPWKEWQTRIATNDELVEWFIRPTAQHRNRHRRDLEDRRGRYRRRPIANLGSPSFAPDRHPRSHRRRR